jgi:hypothetical protein
MIALPKVRRPQKTRSRNLPMKNELILSSLFILTSTTFAVNDATLVSINAPATVEPGAAFAASITFKNTGDTTWGDGFVLGSESLRDNSRWGINRMQLSNGPVAPGANGIFTNAFTAPSSPGIFNFAWKPLQDGLDYFGETVPAQIKIGAGSKFQQGDLIVMQVGDGPATFSTSGSPMILRGVSPLDGAVRFEVQMPTQGTNAFITGGNQFTGMIDLSTDRHQIVMGGYNTNLPYSTTVEAAGSPVPRTAATVDLNGNFILQARVPSGAGQLFNGGTFRGVVSDGKGNFWAGGQNGGIVYMGTNSPAAKIDNAGAGAIRDMFMVNGSIYFSSSQFPVANSNAIVGFTGAPTTVSPAFVEIDITAAPLPGTTAPNLKGFTINDSKTIAFVVDMRTLSAGGGIHRFNGTGAGKPASWTYAYTISDPTLGVPQEVVADFSAAEPVLYVISGVGTATVPNKIVKGVDTGATSTFADFLSAETGNVFRGLTFAPTPAGAPTFTASQAVNIHPAGLSQREAGIAINTDANEALIITTLTDNSEHSYNDPITGQPAMHIMVGYFIDPTTFEVKRGPFPIVGNPSGLMENHSVRWNPVSKKYAVFTTGQTYPPNNLQLIMGAIIVPNSVAGETDPVTKRFLVDPQSTEGYDDVALAVSSKNGNMLLIAERNFIRTDTGARNEGAVGIMFDKDGNLLTPTFTRLDVLGPDGDEDDPDVSYLPQHDLFFFHTNTDDGPGADRIVGNAIATVPNASNGLTIAPAQQLAEQLRTQGQGHPTIFENPFNGELIGAVDYNNGSGGGDLFYLMLNNDLSVTPIRPQTAYVDTSVIASSHRHPLMAADTNNGVIALVHNFTGPFTGIGLTFLGPDGLILPGRPEDTVVYPLVKTATAMDSGANYLNIQHDPHSDSFIVAYSLGAAGGLNVVRFKVTSNHLPETVSLRVERVGGDVKILWPSTASAAGYKLQSTSALGTAFSNVGSTPVVEG